jgi:hypothetical protein
MSATFHSHRWRHRRHPARNIEIGSLLTLRAMIHAERHHST